MVTRGGGVNLETAVISDPEVRQGSVCVCVWAGGGGLQGGGDLETAVCSGVACSLWASAARNLSLRCLSNFLMVIEKSGKDLCVCVKGGGVAGEGRGKFRDSCLQWGCLQALGICDKEFVIEMLVQFLDGDPEVR